MDGHPLLGGLSPVLHHTNDSLYRVPVQKIGRTYTLFVGDNFIREMEEGDVPEEVRTKMTMVLASSNVNRRDYGIKLRLQIYTPPFGGELNDVGWQVSDTMFCLCLSNATLDQLTGKSI